jgi:cytochrome c5
MRKENIVKKLGLLAASIVVGCGLVATAGPQDDAIVDRIQKVGSVCVEGEDCASITSTSVATASGGGAEENYKKTCATCHDIGVAGAPKFGDAAQWESRIAKGMDTLYSSSINGLPPGMPAKGMCFSCSDDDLKALVDYMVNAAK